jgi:hypothetical protein
MLDKYLSMCSLISMLCALQNAVLGIQDDNNELIFSREAAGSRPKQKAHCLGICFQQTAVRSAPQPWQVDRFSSFGLLLLWGVMHVIFAARAHTIRRRRRRGQTRMKAQKDLATRGDAAKTTNSVTHTAASC